MNLKSSFKLTLEEKRAWRKRFASLRDARTLRQLWEKEAAQNPMPSLRKEIEDQIKKGKSKTDDNLETMKKKYSDLKKLIDL